MLILGPDIETGRERQRQRLRQRQTQTDRETERQTPSLQHGATKMVRSSGPHKDYKTIFVFSWVLMKLVGTIAHDNVCDKSI